jgi:hypothetical protein
MVNISATDKQVNISGFNIGTESKDILVTLTPFESRSIDIRQELAD